MTRCLGISFITLVTLISGAVVFSLASAQQKNPDGQTASAQDRLTQNFLAQNEIGRRFRVDPADLPPPKTGPIVTNRSLIVPYSGQVPRVPPGFTATPFATVSQIRDAFSFCQMATFWWPSKAPATSHYYVMTAADTPYGSTAMSRTSTNLTASLGKITAC